MPRHTTGHLRASRVAALSAAAAAALGACGGGDDGPVVASVAIEAFEMGYEPADVTVPAGRVELTLTNTGREAHTFVIDQRGFKLRTFDTGDTDTSIANLPEGAYFFYCDIRGHREQGMEGALFVGDVDRLPTTTEPGSP